MGTLAYMSPEQADPHATPDPRTDIYSLCLVLYETLTLVQPFLSNSTHSTFLKITKSEPPPLRKLNPSVPSALEAIVWKGMASRREERYPDCRALTEDLERFLDHRPVLAPSVTWFRRAERSVVRHRRKIAVYAALFLLALVPFFAWALPALERRARNQLARGYLEDAWRSYQNREYDAAQQFAQNAHKADDPRILSEAHFLSGSCDLLRPAGDPSRGEKQLAKALYYGSFQTACEWHLRSLLSLLQQSVLEGAEGDLEELPAVEDLLADRVRGGPDFQSAAENLRLFLAKHAFMHRRYEQCASFLRKIRDAVHVESETEREAAALLRLLQKKSLQRIAFEWPEAKRVGLEVGRWFGGDGQQVAIITQKGKPGASETALHFYRIVTRQHQPTFEAMLDSPYALGPCVTVPLIETVDVNGDGKEEMFVIILRPTTSGDSSPDAPRERVEISKLAWREKAGR